MERIKPNRPLVGKPTGEITRAGRPVLETPEGEMVSERSRTIPIGGKFYNVPSIYANKEYTEDELKKAIEDNRLIPTSEHDTYEEAIEAAKDRSDSLRPEDDKRAEIRARLEKSRKGSTRDEQMSRLFGSQTKAIEEQFEGKEVFDSESGKDFLVGASDFIPGVSEAKDTAELVRSVSEKDLVGTGIAAASLLLGTIPFAGDTLRKALRSSVDPIKTKKAYKLFVQRDGKLYPLFVDSDKEVITGKFVRANFPEEAFTAPNGKKYVPSKGAVREKGEKRKATGERIAIPDKKTRDKLIELGYITEKTKGTKDAPFGYVTAVAARPGYHASQLPVATHIGPQDIKVTKKEADKLLKEGITKEAIKKRGDQLYVKRRAEDHVYAEVEMPDDVDYQTHLKEIGKTDINDYVPVGGSYKYVDGQADSDKWVVGGSVKINKVLSKDESRSLQKQLNVKDLPHREDVENILGRKLFEGGLLRERNMIDDYVVAKTSPMEMKQGGMAFMQEGGMQDDGGETEPKSGNKVPSGSLKEEVADDIPTMLSEGEFVFPADVVRYIGLETLMKMRQDAKQGLKMMEKMGQLGNPEEAEIPDDVPFGMADLVVISGEMKKVK